ncbi:MAG: hypothetical protein QNJ97_29295 [Myxococcota bacterium]|nr:hypothetical protein [Myxococcota bacterium]
MALDFFNFRLGIGQGRMKGQDSDDYVFVLGDAVPGNYGCLKQGDCAEIFQETDLTNVDFIRTEITMATPEEMPETFCWEVSIIIGSIKHSSVLCEPGRQRRITDLAANVSKLSGVHEVGVRLEFCKI